MSERIDATAATSNETEKDIDGHDHASSHRPPQRGVRDRFERPARDKGSQDASRRPAHPSNQLVAQLNASWRVVDDPLQWILQRRKGNPRKKSSGWQGRSFCRTRDALLRCVREYCCSPDKGQRRCIREYQGVDKVALQQVCALPDWHLDEDVSLRGQPATSRPSRS